MNKFFKVNHLSVDIATYVLHLCWNSGWVKNPKFMEQVLSACNKEDCLVVVNLNPLPSPHFSTKKKIVDVVLCRVTANWILMLFFNFGKFWYEGVPKWCKVCICNYWSSKWCKFHWLCTQFSSPKIVVVSQLLWWISLQLISQFSVHKMQDFKNVCNMRGGYTDWVKNGFAVKKHEPEAEL